MKAFFGPPIDKIVPGGAHLAQEVITRKKGALVMQRRPEGLFGQNRNQWFFAHGAFNYGESPSECASRLVREHLAAGVSGYRLIDAWSWVEEDHWYLVLVSLADVDGEFRPGEGVSEVGSFDLHHLPDGMAYWTKSDLIALLQRSHEV